MSFQWWYKFTYYICAFILGVVIITLSLRYFGGRIDDTRVRSMIGAHAYSIPEVSWYVEKKQVYYIGIMDARCDDCMGSLDILQSGYSHISLMVDSVQGTYVHCLSYSNSSKPWEDSGVQWWGDAWMPINDVDLTMTDEELAADVLDKIDRALEAGALSQCKLSRSDRAPWEGGDDLQRLIVRALR